MNSSNPFVTNPQSMGASERMAYGFVFFLTLRLAAKMGWSAEFAEYLALGIVTAGGAILGWWNNKPSVIAATVANMSRDQLARPEVAAQVVAAAGAVPNPSAPDGKTIVVTSPALATATPDAPTVVSSTAHEVVSR